MNIDCEMHEGDLAGHLMDTLVYLDQPIDDCIEALVYVLADCLAQATNYEHDSDNEKSLIEEVTECYQFVCDGGGQQDTISIQ